ncbi:putative T7SS-secreted protein [Streptomyces sp. NPDC050264]|uniref:putative T7SS-secreted protein n=1 Tax=Streptomyces sp. NPDC050264 TaxID=3155038 RepID=UPI0034236EA7
MGIIGDLKDGLNDGLKAGGDLIDSGKKKLGEVVDYGSDKLGDGLDDVGLDKAGDWVHKGGDYVAAGLGATPTEQGLGHTDDPTELVHGKPGKIREAAKHLKDFYTAFDKVGRGMRKVDASGWKGEAGDAFHRKISIHPTKWAQAADACEDAAKALDSYADSVKWAQDKAQDAIDTYNRGKRTSAESAKAYNKRIDAYNVKTLSGEDPGPEPEPWKDPGEADRSKAEHILEDARRARNEAAARAEAAVDAALAHAPAEPPPLTQLSNTLVDASTALDVESTHLLGGVIKGSAGLVNFARGLNPTDPYNLTHPAAYYQGLNMTLTGLVSTGTHPERIVTAVVDGLKNDRSEFIGRLLPELLGTKGAGFAKSGMRLAMREGTEAAASNIASRGLRAADDVGGARGGLQAADDIGGAPHLPDSWKLDEGTAAKDLDGAAHADDGLQHSKGISNEEFTHLTNEQKHAVASSELNDGALTFPDENAAISHGRETWNSYADNLPESTKNSLLDYSNDHYGNPSPQYATYKEMNGYLRGADELGTPQVVHNIAETDKALAGNPLAQDTMVVRGQDVEYLGVNKPEQLIGEEISDPAYLSTSLGDNGAVFDKEAIVHLRVPEGHSALWMENVSHYGVAERELLLGRDTTYRVTRAFEDNGKWHIYGEVLPQK